MNLVDRLENSTSFRAGMARSFMAGVYISGTFTSRYYLSKHMDEEGFEVFTDSKIRELGEDCWNWYNHNKKADGIFRVESLSLAAGSLSGILFNVYDLGSTIKRAREDAQEEYKSRTFKLRE